MIHDLVTEQRAQQAKTFMKLSAVHRTGATALHKHSVPRLKIEVLPEIGCICRGTVTCGSILFVRDIESYRDRLFLCSTPVTLHGTCAIRDLCKLGIGSVSVLATNC